MKKPFALLTIALSLFTATQANAATLSTQGTSFEQGLYQTEAPEPYGVNYSQNSSFESTNTNKLNWHFDLDYDDPNDRSTKGFRSKPVVDKDGDIYINNQNKKMYAFKPDGSLKWTKEDLVETNNVVSISIGKDGTLYNPAKNLYAINPDNGETKWIGKTDKTSNFDQAVIDKEGTIFAVSMNEQDAFLYAYNPDGTLNHKGTTNLAKYGHQSTYNKGMYIGKNGLIYIMTDTISAHYILALTKEGDLAWAHPINYGRGGFGLNEQGNIVVSAGNLSAKQFLYTLNGETGEKMKEVVMVDRTSSIITSPVVDQSNGDIYVNVDSNLVKYDKDLNVIWTKPFGLTSEVTIDKSHNIVFSSNKGIYKIDPNGEVLWTIDPRALSNGGSGALGLNFNSPTIDAQGRVYTAYQSSRLNEQYLHFDFVSIGDPILQLDNTCVNLDALEEKAEKNGFTASEKEQEMARLQQTLDKIKASTPTEE